MCLGTVFDFNKFVDTETTYTFEDLKCLDFPGTSLAVLGFPVRHSISPVIHNAAIARLSETDSPLQGLGLLSFRGGS